MANIVKTIEEIISMLNGSDPERPWIDVAGYFSLLGADIAADGKINTKQESIGLKVFYNTKTGEIKTFVAKHVDIEASRLLQ